VIFKKEDKKDKVPGDVLGLTDDRTGVKLPHPPSDGSVASGIEVEKETRHWGADELQRSKGATGVDMGGGGEGTDIAPPRSARKEIEEP
jgi:hypothetical protein